jgi:hypothetical protein
VSITLTCSAQHHAGLGSVAAPPAGCARLAAELAPGIGTLERDCAQFSRLRDDDALTPARARAGPMDSKLVSNLALTVFLFLPACLPTCASSPAKLHRPLPFRLVATCLTHPWLNVDGPPVPN